MDLRQSANLPVGTMGALPNELTIQVFSSLNTKDLLHVSQTCKHWNYLSEDDFLWKPLYKARWNKPQATGARRVKKKQGKETDQEEIRGWRSWKNKYTTNGNWLTGHLIYQTSFAPHQRVISSVQFDNDKYVTGAEDSAVRVFSGADGTQQQVLNGHSESISCLQYNGNVLVTGSKDKTLRVWNLDTGECTHTLKGHTAKITCLQFQDHRLITRSWDLAAKIWDLNTGQCISNRRCKSVVFSMKLEGSQLLCGYMDNQLKIWDLRTGQFHRSFNGHRVILLLLIFIFPSLLCIN